MKMKAAIGIITMLASGLALPGVAAGQVPPGVGEGWNGEFDHAARQITQLAEAIPADKYSWRPGAGVRSVAEVLMHIAVANHFLLGPTGAKPAVDLAKLGKDPEKGLTTKNEIIPFLKASFDAVRAAAPTLDKSQRVKLFGKEVTNEGVLTRLLVHNHEHMGQLIAYARVNGVVPPWSAKGGQ